MVKQTGSKTSAALYLSLFIFLVVLFKTAWVSDDAYITFRSIENYIHGYGLVFNVGERVQTYTHPLWFFLQTAVNYFVQKVLKFDFWSQMYYLNVFLSIGISVFSILLIPLFIAKSRSGSIAAVIILITSRAFMDYSTSGLENPLSHLLLAVYFYVYFTEIKPKSRKLYLLSSLACLGALNRLDTILVFFPPLLFFLFKGKNTIREVGSVFLGFLPLMLWELFSLFYYGALFPNTAFAKLNTGISRGSLISQGCQYFKQSFFYDPITLLIIGGVLCLVFFWGRKKMIPFAISILLYLGYILMIGGDFMSGRFFSLLILISAFILSWESFSEYQYVYGGFILVVLTIGLLNPTSPIRATRDYGNRGFQEYINKYGISDERAVYYPYLGLFSQNYKEGFPGSKYSGDNWIFIENKQILKVVGPLGVEGYALGPNTHVIDTNSLADPLMARLPLQDSQDWRIGHFKHQIPEGYLETLSSGENNIVDPDIARYYDKLRFIVRGELFNKERIKDIFRLTLGQYDNLLVTH